MLEKTEQSNSCFISIHIILWINNTIDVKENTRGCILLICFQSFYIFLIFEYISFTGKGYKLFVCQHFVLCPRVRQGKYVQFSQYCVSEIQNPKQYFKAWTQRPEDTLLLKDSNTKYLLYQVKHKQTSSSNTRVLGK